MNRVAVFIDAGYLYAASIKAVTGMKQSRSAITLAYEDFLPFIIERAQHLSGRELLRVYWYDGTSTGPTGAHRKLAYQANVKLRLGMVSLSGEQRGVDSLLIMDMANLAQNRAMSDVVLLTGDEDIRVGVVLAQQYGVRVHLVGIPDPEGERNQSSMLLQEADTTSFIQGEDLARFISVNERINDETDSFDDSDSNDSPSTLLHEAVQLVLSGLPIDELEQIRESLGAGAQSVPAQIDRQLLIAGRQRLQRDLVGYEKRQLRNLFSQELRRQNGALPDGSE
ncbi:MAG: NYN domain protein [Alphaproteobacteria bacterium ADurb.BinA280]|jgi:uncharacterized LabA/DUF88 family protein|nr:NYN domain-containing protein [Xanthomonadales bacterium]MCC6504678.1 NYN domain-containing protein [Aquimonas sp.]OPZ11490.1 MAG: NYN domain protein [Alphaproteobacteria bacterium ADurb.BinA280]